MKLADVYNPQRIKQVEQVQTNAFMWKKQGYIPLGIWIVNEQYGQNLDYSRWLEPESWFDFQVKVLTETLAVGSDLLPVIAINHLGMAVISSMFGANLRMPQKAISTLQDNGPSVEPIISSISEVETLTLI